MMFLAFFALAAASVALSEGQIVQASTVKPTHHHVHHNHTKPPHHGHHSNVTREPGEHENFGFVYLSATLECKTESGTASVNTYSQWSKQEACFARATKHRMYIKNGHSCYMSDLSADERLAVHTDAGIRNLELKMLQLLASAKPVANTTLTHQEIRICGHNINHYFFIDP